MGRSRYLRAVHAGPAGGLDPEAPEALLECLTGVSERIGRQAVLIAMDDLSAIAVSRVAPMLRDRFRIPHQPDNLPARVADKAELSRLCSRWDVPHPETVIPASGAEAAEAAWRLGLPVVAKWSRPWLLPTGADGLRSTTLVHTAAEARRLYERSAEAGSRLLLQRFLPAGPDTDWFFHGAFTRGGLPLLAGSGRKELSWPVRTGLTAVGRWLPDPAVEEAALRLAERLGYQGILDLDFRRDEEGCFRLVDFNPRPGAQFRLFTDAAGLDVVQAMYMDLTGQRVPQPSGGPGRVFVAENYALLAAVRGGSLPRRRAADRTVGPAGPAAADRADGAADPDPPVVAGQRTGQGRPAAGPAPKRGGGVETAWFAADDLRPFLAMLGAFLGRGAGKGVRVLRGVPAQGRRTARAVVRTPRQRAGERPATAPGSGPATTPAAGPAAPASRPVPPEASAEPDELVTR
ncbi:MULTISPECIES: ATP-grasp domain-containing protein [unclassified Streptomyces]|uniref:carboxylate--amine ligase n=1 Tax=unclassified Streptomyces TaxID=2593676 RepID=UPI002886E829|nr:ATP-grasp domain-containing protein [Streptomyces sp. DSM 41633]